MFKNEQVGAGVGGGGVRRQVWTRGMGKERSRMSRWGQGLVGVG